MVRFVRKVVIEGMPKALIMKTIESLSEAFIDDARQNYSASWKFKTGLKTDDKKGTVDSSVSFFPYHYSFAWDVKRKDDGYEVVLNARTKGKWYEFLLDVGAKTKDLVDTQWSGFINFCVGYLTAEGYEKGKEKAHIKHARARVKQ